MGSDIKVLPFPSEIIRTHPLLRERLFIVVAGGVDGSLSVVVAQILGRLLRRLINRTMDGLTQAVSPTDPDDEIEVREVFRALWNGKWLIGGITPAATVIAVIMALMVPSIYRAEALLVPNDFLNFLSGADPKIAEWPAPANRVVISTNQSLREVLRNVYYRKWRIPNFRYADDFHSNFVKY